jgi:putative spermidine/putrescine transport system permease protein
MTGMWRRFKRNPEAPILGAFVLLFFTFMLAPILIVVVVAFNDANFIAFPLRGFSVRWFYRIVEYRPFLDSFIVSLQLAFASTLLAGVVGVPAALALVRGRSVYANAIATFLLSPLSMPLIVLGFAFLFFLSAIGFGVSFLSLLISHTVVGLPYIMRTVGGVYRAISTDFEETASILGASRWQTFWHVTLPLIRPGIFAGALFSILISFDNLPVSFFFGSATTNTLPVVMLSYMEHQFDPSIAALSAVQMLLAVVALLVVERVYGLKHMSAPT